MSMAFKKPGECEFSTQVYSFHIFFRRVHSPHGFDLRSLNQDVLLKRQNPSGYVENMNV